MVRISNSLCAFALLLCCALPALAQQPAAETSQVVPPMVNFSGVLTDVNGKPLTGVVGVTFYLYKDSEGGVPLWMETQNVRPNSNGRYSVMLGSTTNTGLPSSLFAAGEARWLGVQVEGQQEQPRVVLLSVPYALKAADSETLGGLPLSAFVLANSARSGTSQSRSISPASARGLNVAKSSVPANPAVTGLGTVGNIPMWDTTSDIINSVMVQKTSLIGINTATPAALLDVNGKSDIRDTLTLFPLSTDNTLAVNGTAFKVSSTGLVTFITGQKFPGTGTITGITTAAGSGLSGGGTTGTLSLKVPALGITNAMLANSKITLNANTAGGLTTPGAMTLGGTSTIGLKACAANQILQFSGTVWNCANPAVGTITGITTAAGSGLTGGGTSGNLSLSVNPAVVPELALKNAFTNNNSITVNSTSPDLSITNTSTGSTIGNGNGVNVTVTASGAQAVAAQGGYEGFVGSSSPFPVVGFGSTYGVFGETMIDANFQPSIYGYASGTTQITIGVEGLSPSPVGVGISGVGIGFSAEGSNVAGSGSVGVWGDTSGDMGVLGTVDSGNSIVGFNSSDPFATGYFENDTSVSPTAPVLVTVGGNFSGSCMFDVSGDMFCSGSKSAVVPVDNGARKVALYAVESPKNWFEDFGSASLSNGSAVIPLESTFAQTVNTASYHVFLTPNGDCKGLYVSQKGAGGFEVRELGGGASNISFDYRIVAERLGYENVRMADKTQLFRQAAALKRSHRRAAPLHAPTPQRPKEPARAAMVVSPLSSQGLKTR